MGLPKKGMVAPVIGKEAPRVDLGAADNHAAVDVLLHQPVLRRDRSREAFQHRICRALRSRHERQIAVRIAGFGCSCSSGGSGRRRLPAALPTALALLARLRAVFRHDTLLGHSASWPAEQNLG